MRVLDLFAGIGGFSIGFERAGAHTVAFCEIDPFARRVLAKHWPDVPCHDDITTREFIQGEADVITAGFPCQDVSFAGAGAGLAGERSGLYREVVRAIRLVRPKFAVLENVAALLSRGLGTVLGDLAEIGYDAEWHCIPASAVGAPHRRDRIWIIADPRGEQHESRRAPLSGEIAAELSRANPDAEGERCREARGFRHHQPQERSASLCEAISDPASVGRQQRDAHTGRRSDRGGEEQRSGPGSGSWWAVEPDVGRVANGVPARVDRLGRLGNAVVPQNVEVIARPVASTLSQGARS